MAVTAGVDLLISCVEEGASSYWFNRRKKLWMFAEFDHSETKESEQNHSEELPFGRDN